MDKVYIVMEDEQIVGVFASYAAAQESIRITFERYPNQTDVNQMRIVNYYVHEYADHL